LQTSIPRHGAGGVVYLKQSNYCREISRNERTVVVADMDGTVEIVDPLLVTSLAVPDGSSQAQSS